MNLTRALCTWAMDNDITYVYADAVGCWGEITYCAETDVLFHKLDDPAGRTTYCDPGYYVIPYGFLHPQAPAVPDELTDDGPWPLPSISAHLFETGQIVPSLPWATTDYTYLGSDDSGGSVFAGKVPDQFVGSGGTVDVKGTIYALSTVYHFTNEPTLP